MVHSSWFIVDGSWFMEKINGGLMIYSKKIEKLFTFDSAMNYFVQTMSI